MSLLPEHRSSDPKQTTVAIQDLKMCQLKESYDALCKSACQSQKPESYALQMLVLARSSLRICECTFHSLTPNTLHSNRLATLQLLLVSPDLSMRICLSRHSEEQNACKLLHCIV